MPKLRASTTTRFYDPDDEEKPRRRRRGRDPIRELARFALVVFALYLIYWGLTHGHH